MTQIFCGQLITPRAVLSNQIITIDGATIVAVEPVDGGQRGARAVIDASDAIVIPGLIDLQVNGALGYSFQAQHRAYFDVVTKFHLHAGTTVLLPTLVTAPEDTLSDSLATLAEYLPTAPADLPGIHLEGPFLSPEKRGAHAVEHLRLPNPQMLQRFVDAAAGRLKLVTLAPELTGSFDLIAYLVARGVVVSAGHSTATYATMLSAVGAGLSMVTHAGNASDWPHREINQYGFLGNEPGVVGSLLALPQLRGCVILDGFHFHPALLKPILKVKGAENLILVSDASTVVGCPPGDYEGGGISATVDARGFATSRRGGKVLAGSTITLLQALQRAVNLAGIALQDAVTMATLTPATALGLEHRIGTISVGADANLLVLNQDLTLRQVVLRGRLVDVNG